MGDPDDWVRYFLHSGHLTIAGCKMSKSLKNFITIKDALKKHSARQLRLAFLLHAWKDTLDYSGNTMEMAVQWEKNFNEFFLNIKDLLRGTDLKNCDFYVKWNDDDDLKLQEEFVKKKTSVHKCLCDNIDTRGALENMRELIALCNVYMKKKTPNCLLLKTVAKYLTDMLRIFGVIPSPDAIGLPLGSGSDVNDKEKLVTPYVECLAEFREDVRRKALDVKAVEILKACDVLRDETLPSIGVRLEDHGGDRPVVKFVDEATLAREKAEKDRLADDKQKAKDLKKKQDEAAQAEKDAQRRIPPADLFKNQTDKYSKFDSKGIPTHDADGKELSKSGAKKIAKLYEAQEKKYNDWIKSQGDATS
jgi:cysteinyl-tRNA synthetase